MDPVEAFLVQSVTCAELGSPMYAGLLARCAADVEAGGPVREVLAGHEDDPGPSALALRLLGWVHRLVLERRAAELAVFYPSVGGTWEPEPGWLAFRELVMAQPEAVREWLDRAPQTNEVARAGALYGGLLHRRLAHLRVEPERRRAGGDHEVLVSLTTWPGGVASRCSASPTRAAYP